MGRPDRHPTAPSVQHARLTKSATPSHLPIGGDVPNAVQGTIQSQTRRETFPRRKGAERLRPILPMESPERHHPAPRVERNLPLEGGGLGGGVVWPRCRDPPPNAATHLPISLRPTGVPSGSTRGPLSTRHNRRMALNAAPAAPPPPPHQGGGADPACGIISPNKCRARHHPAPNAERNLPLEGEAWEGVSFGPDAATRLPMPRPISRCSSHPPACPRARPEGLSQPGTTGEWP
jgi:hypothetical protein